MSTDWNQKLAWVLRDLPDETFDLLQLSSHRSAFADLPAEITLDVGPRDSWLTSAADRVPFPSSGAASKVQIDWSAAPEITHPTVAHRHTIEGFDLEAARKATADLMGEAAKRFGKDSRRAYLWMWRYLAERLAASAGSGAHAVPADPRMPNVSTWHRLAFDGALASAAPSPSFLTVHIAPSEAFVEQAETLGDLWANGHLLTWLAWQAMLPVVEALGPDAILTPSLRHHPIVDGWLAEQGVTASDGSKPSEGLVALLPSSFTALVPADRAAELGAAIKQRVADAWTEVVTKVRDGLIRDGWTKGADETWTTVWSRQSAAAWDVTWSAVGWGDDSTGAGGLLPKTEVTSFEKWARLQEDAAGLDDPWPGIYFGLWLSGSLSAASARRRVGSPALTREPSTRCTVCRKREVLHLEGSIADFWASVAGPKGASKGKISQGEALCAVCTVRRMSQGAVSMVPAPSELAALASEERYALVVFELDQPLLVLRGGKELKQGATAADGLHGQLVKSFATRARSHLKEILETIPPLGPSRIAGVSDALRDFALYSAPALAKEHSATLLAGFGHELIFAAPVGRAYALARALRSAHRQAFVTLTSEHGTRMGTHLGEATPASAVVALVGATAPVGRIVGLCRSTLESRARGQLGGDALVVLRVGDNGEQQIHTAHWDDYDAAMGAYMAALPDPSDRKRLLSALMKVQPALSNPDLDRPAPGARLSLVQTALEESGLTGVVQDAEAVARAVCSVIDHGVRLSPAAAEAPFDGLALAVYLHGADR